MERCCDLSGKAVLQKKVAVDKEYTERSKRILLFG